MLTVVGLGPGSEEYLTLKAIAVLRNADIVLTPSRFLNIVRKYAQGSDIVILNPKSVRMQILELVHEHPDSRIVVVSSGDPLFSGIGKSILDLGLKCEIIPGISSIQLACAKVGTSWDNMIFLSLHEREHIERAVSILRTALARELKIGVLTSPDYPPHYVISLVRTCANMLRSHVQVHVCQNLSLENENIVTLDDLCKTRVAGLDWNSVIIIEPHVDRHRLLYEPLNI